MRRAPNGARLGIRFDRGPTQTRMVVWDSGPGIGDEARTWLFRPFAAANGVLGAGLGLSICPDIAHSMQADIELVNRSDANGRVPGLGVVVTWPHPGV